MDQLLSASDVERAPSAALKGARPPSPSPLRTDELFFCQDYKETIEADAVTADRTGGSVVPFEPEETEGVRGEDLPPVIFAYGQGH